MPALIVAFATFCSTSLGGLFALRFKDKLRLIVGFSAGAVVGVAFFDLMPEAFEQATAVYPLAAAVGVVGLGFAVFLALDRLLHVRVHDEDTAADHARLGNFGAGTLSLHSFLEGLSIGLAFKVSLALGLVVAAAILTHDFADGINTVVFVVKHGGGKRKALRWLLADAIAPMLGVIATFFFSVPAAELGLLLALVSGFFLYIGGSDLVPSSYRQNPSLWTTAATLAGMAVIFGVVQLAG